MDNLQRRANFELAKARRAVVTHGKMFTFTRVGRNEYGELDESVIDSISLNGVFHTTNGYITITRSDSSKMMSEPQPQILCSMDKYPPKNISGFISNPTEYTLVDKGVDYEVTGVTDVNKMGVILEVSLEVIQHG